MDSQGKSWHARIREHRVNQSIRIVDSHDRVGLISNYALSTTNQYNGYVVIPPVYPRPHT